MVGGPRTAAGRGGEKFDTVRSTDRDGYKEFAGLIRYSAEHEELPALLLAPTKYWTNHVAVWLDADGKAGLFTADGATKPYGGSK